jgi:hypothetical protein
VTYFQKMIRTVANLDFTGHPVDDFAAGAFVIFAAALARLREAAYPLPFPMARTYE